MKTSTISTTNQEAPVNSEEVLAEEQAPTSEETVSETEREEEGQLSIDMYQTATDVVVVSTIAGVSPQDLNITLNNDLLTITGKRKQPGKVKAEDYYYQECYWGSFSRSVVMPVEIDSDKIKADICDGVLTITLPKSKQSLTKTIKVRSASK